MKPPTMRSATAGPRIISICNQKGGVGKTTTAVNLAACLAAAEKKVLLIDLDPQGNATSGVGVDKQSVAGSSYQLLTTEAVGDSLTQPTEIPSLFIIPASADLVGAEIELTGIDAREMQLRQALKGCFESFDYVFIDCPPSLGLLTVNAMTAADALLVPVQCEYYALEGLAELHRTIGLVASNLNRGLQIQGIVLTMYDPRNNLCKQVVEEVRGHFKTRVYDAMIPRNVRLSESPSFGKPIILYDIHSKGSASYLALAQEFLRREDAYVPSEEGIREGVGLADPNVAAAAAGGIVLRGPDDSGGRDPTQPPTAP